MPVSRTSIVAAALIVLVGSADVHAQPAPPEPSPPTPTPPTAAAPAPETPAKAEEKKAEAKVQKAKDVGKRAELTPIIPSPNDVTKPAFQLYGEIDLPLLAVGVIFAGARYVRTQPAFCAPLCNSNQLNALDRLTAGYYSTYWQASSNAGLGAILVATATILGADEGLLPALNDAVVVGESALTATALASMMTIAAARPRPLLFGEKAPLSVRNGPDAGLSFLSSHTTMSFAIVTSLFIAERRLHPKSQMPKVLLGVGLGVASWVAISRVMAGKHFITDALGGAVLGTALGILVPSLHKSPVHVVPLVNAREQGVGMSVSF